MGNKVKLGEILGLEVQLGDGTSNIATTRVFADIRELDGTLIEAEFEMFHVGNGKYTDETKLMPAFDKITVTYYIRRADGTTPSNKYNPNYLSEQFMRDIVAEIVEGGLSASASANEIVGTLDSSADVVGTIDDVEILTVVTEEQTIIGVVTDEC